MERVDYCIVCENKKVSKYPGKLAPFISHYVFDGRETEANLTFCPRCQMLFSDARFDYQEMQRLYQGYRGPRYSAEREKYEPGYGSKNDHLTAADLEVVNRSAFCATILSSFRGDIRSVMDFGGDRGQFIPKSLQSADRYVFELSDVEPIEGVVSLASPDTQAPYDLVMCCHVLEHVSFPVALLRQLRDLMTDKSALYVEVPAGIPTRRYFEASLARKHISRNRPIRFHEHINYFTKASLRNALSLSGFRPLTTKIGLIEFGWTQAPVIASVAVPSQAAAHPPEGRFSLLREGFEYAIRRNLMPAFGTK